MVDIDMSNSDMDLGSMIKDQVAQSIQNVDVLSMLQKMVASTPEDEESEDIRQKLQGILAQYNNLPENEKIQFVQQLKDVLASKLAMKLKDSPIDFSGVEDAIKDAVVSQLYFVAAAIFVFIVLLVFFGYKLYKSIKDKEKKREEKKKLKQMKKKK
ncbi:uncharacterized protein LOC125074224 [Vanessa atalanta]|uniref:uncharacterized protein LOC125074224 n=1 Tax=Vanessa atalanta TaxID=42275 RepID=UPI001FCD7EBC|nr:uncharacterized protein LOC125074224 [Vanessa atalanta]